MTTLRIGSRGSALALWQANFVRDEIRRIGGGDAEIVRIRTTGDKDLDAAIPAFGGKGIFIKEIEEALLDGRVDVAVHSMKDLPTEMTGGLTIAAVPPRANAGDCLISHDRRSLTELPAGARIGTSSLRRQSQLKRFRPGWEISDLRGNVDTRLRKLDEGKFDAIVLARAGLERLGFGARITEEISLDVMLPAVGQGALCVQTRADDSELNGLLRALDDSETRTCVTAERALLARLQGGCQVPLGAFAQFSNGSLSLEACVLSVDGRESIRESTNGKPDEPEKVGRELAEKLLEAGAGRLLQLAGRDVA